MFRGDHYESKKKTGSVGYKIFKTGDIFKFTLMSFFLFVLGKLLTFLPNILVVS